MEVSHEQPRSASATVALLVQELAGMALEPHLGEERERAAKKATRMCLRILGSSIGCNEARDEGVLALAIKKRMLLDDKEGTDRALKFQELHRRLQAVGTLEASHRGSVLHLLDCLSRVGPDAAAPPVGLMTLPALGQQAMERLGRAAAPPGKLVPRGDCSMEEVGAGQSTAKEAVNATEQAVIRDVIFALQGIDGHYIKYCSDTDSHMVDPVVLGHLPPGSGDLILGMCEMSWLFTRVVTYVNRTRDAEAGDVRPGLVRQAFAFSLNEELTDYYRLLAVLDAQLSAGGSLTLRRLAVWAQDPTVRLRLMATLVDAAGSLQGGALASCLHTHMQHGDPAVRAFVERTLRRVCSPLFAMIKDWVFEGQLVDPNGEFFVGSMSEVPADRLWQDKYFLNASVLPKFISPEMANKILVIGKSINFMHLCCKAPARVMIPELREAVNLFDEGGGRLEYSGGGAAALQDVVDHCSHVTNAHILDLLLNQHKLMAHLQALKKFLLLGQGDFVTFLMDRLGGELGKRASQIFRHNLTGIVESALRSSTVQYESPDMLDRVAVRLLEPSAGDTGWEVFSLDYIVESPLTAVIHSMASLKYRRMFHLLWRLKRVEWALNKSWSQHMSINHMGVGGVIPQLRSTLHRCSLVRGQMLFFTSNLSSYMMFEVLETSWQELEARLQHAADLDEVICAHDDYLETILEKALLGPGSQDIMQQLNSLLDSIIQFCAHQEVLIVKAMAEMAARREEASNVEKNTKQGRWGTELGVKRREDLFEEAGHIPMGRFDIAAMAKIEDTATTYTSAFVELLNMLDERSKSSEILRYLTFRLDFNLFYSSQQQQPSP
jgi:gamma-tubulin complex component 3